MEAAQAVHQLYMGAARRDKTILQPAAVRGGESREEGSKGMIEVSFRTLLDGVMRSLAERFPEIPVQREQSEQKAEGPCFYVEMLKALQERELNRRYHRACSFQVQFVSGLTTQGPNMSVHDMAEHLYELFRELDIDGARYMGTQMKHEVRDEVLFFDFSFQFLVWLPAGAEPKMQTLKEEESLKNDSKKGS